MELGLGRPTSRGKGQREGSGSRCRKANVQGNPGVRAQCADQIFLVGVFPLSFLYLFLLFLSSKYFKSKRKTIDFGVVTPQSNPPENGTVKSVCRRRRVIKCQKCKPATGSLRLPTSCFMHAVHKNSTSHCFT